MVRKGLWQCPRCRFFWIWRTERDVLDRICPKDAGRVQTRLDRKKGGRGRPAPCVVLERPSYMPLSALRKEQKSRNRNISGLKRAEDRKLGYRDGFVKAVVVAEEIERLYHDSAGDPTEGGD